MKVECCDLCGKVLENKPQVKDAVKLTSYYGEEILIKKLKKLRTKMYQLADTKPYVVNEFTVKENTVICDKCFSRIKNTIFNCKNGIDDDGGY